jgi:ElaB/YqjD/DUF883 family membrane-anchored ribosome-binding protein
MRDFVYAARGSFDGFTGGILQRVTIKGAGRLQIQRFTGVEHPMAEHAGGSYVVSAFNTTLNPKARIIMKLRNGTQDLQQDITELKNNAKALLAATGNLAGDAIAQARNKLAASLEATRAVQSVKSADRKLRANPYQAVAIAFGVGTIFGLFLARRRR